MAKNYGDDLPFSFANAGSRTEFGYTLPPGGRVAAYVRSTGVQSQDDEQTRRLLVTTLNSGLARCRSAKGDVVVVLPGHSESISSADAMSSLVAGTRIIGTGAGTLRPTFTWTAAGATFLFDVANVSLSGCILKMADAANGGVTVAAPITVSAAGCSITNCQIFFGDDANDIVTIGITTTAAADDFLFAGNDCFGATAAECTTFMRLVGADRAKLISNRIVGATSNAAIGLIQFLTTASTDVTIDGLYVRNNKSGGGAGDQAITGMAGIGGYADNLFMVVLGNNAANLTGAFGTPANMVFGRRCYVANTIAERAALFGTESA